MLADEMRVALSSGWDGDAGIAEHRLRRRRRHHDVRARGAFDRIFEVQKRALFVMALDLEIGDRGEQLRVQLTSRLSL